MLVALTAGAVAALLTVSAARRFRLAWERAFYCALLAVIAAIYPALLWFLGGSRQALAQETIAAAAFALLAILALRLHPFTIAVGLLAHALWDFAHASVPGTPVPEWYVWACLAFDLTAGIYAFSRLGDWRVLQPA